jgi:hypothetical protein
MEEISGPGYSLTTINNHNKRIYLYTAYKNEEWFNPIVFGYKVTAEDSWDVNPTLFQFEDDRQ